MQCTSLTAVVIIMDSDKYDAQKYEALAETIKIDDITSDTNNRRLLQQIRDDTTAEGSDYVNEGLHAMWICGSEARDDGSEDFCPTSADELGWLWYYLGKNKQLKRLNIGHFNDDFATVDVDPFFRGLKHNDSIEALAFTVFDFRGGDVFRMLTPFFQGDRCLTKVELNECNLGDEGCHFLSLALGGCNLLKRFELVYCGITDSQSVSIIGSLGRHAQLESIQLYNNSIGRAGCVAFAKEFQWETTNVQKIDLGNNSIDDGGIEALMPALAMNSNLRELNLDGNTSITIRGFGALSSVLESPTLNLKKLSLVGNHICDKVLKMLACALVNNSSLKWLQLNGNVITDESWPALSQILCNTSSINATYLSNHTLVSVGGITPDIDLNCLLALNESGCPRKKIAMMKILKYHNIFDMQQLFEWDFKVLPCMIEWFEKAAECPYYLDKFRLPDLEAMVQQRKLSAIYQFIRGMPLEFIEARSMHELKEIAARKKRLNSELKILRNELDDAEDAERQILRSRASR